MINKLYWIFAILGIYTFVTISIYRFKNPTMTETELFLSIPSVWVWDMEGGAE